MSEVRPVGGEDRLEARVVEVLVEDVPERAQALRKRTGSMSSPGIPRIAAICQKATSRSSRKKRSTRSRLPGNASSSASAAPAQSAGTVTSWRPGTTAR
ncbi:hypothetical protein [Streptomyces wedmorensis]|uniref:hypothetical protein n=1 Tax=Streptomyces wedmorensis TaxID=43759 RepID=UPI0037980F7D